MTKQLKYYYYYYLFTASWPPALAITYGLQNNY
jgi:hypothetical protein